jgi:hypothetical protein
MVKDMVIHHKDGDVGKLKRADAEQWDDGGRELCDVIVEWEKKGKQEHRRWDLEKMFVKEAASGEELYEKPE